MSETDSRKMVSTKLPVVLARSESSILEQWTQAQRANLSPRTASLIREEDSRAQSKQFLAALREAAQSDQLDNIEAEAWTKVRQFLGDLSVARAKQGSTPAETATFIFSLKQPLFDRLGKEFGNDAQELTREVWTATLLLDKLALYTTEVAQKERESVILRQQQELLELSTPVVRLWDSIVALPLIGTLDSARTQVVMENLLQVIVNTGASIAIIDITKDSGGSQADGSRLHHQRHSSANRPDHRTSGGRTERSDHEGFAG
jgi:rsbT co-antagonist protein RsbR